MKLFRSAWLQSILLFLFLVLLNPGFFDFVEDQGNANDEVPLYSSRYFPKTACELRKFKVKNGLDLIHESIVPIPVRIISGSYIPGIVYSSAFIDFFDVPSRAPPHLRSLL